MRAPRDGLGSSVHAALMIPLGPCLARAPAPTTNLRVLSDARSRGVDVASLLDRIVDSRVGCAVTEGTGRTYDSHLNQVRWACELLDAAICPADLETIRRVAGIVNNASTLRGWLGAWRHYGQGLLGW